MARHLSADDFFAQLASLIEKTQQKGHGSVYLTQKRRTPCSDPNQLCNGSADALQSLSILAIHPQPTRPRRKWQTTLYGIYIQRIRSRS